MRPPCREALLKKASDEAEPSVKPKDHFGSYESAALCWLNLGITGRVVTVTEMDPVINNQTQREDQMSKTWPSWCFSQHIIQDVVKLTDHLPLITRTHNATARRTLLFTYKLML